MAGTISIKDIARIAGVNFSTVSRALNDSPRVNAATRARIQRIAAEMGYLPSAVARSLVTQRTRTLGVLVTTVTDPFSAQIVDTVAELAGGRGYSIILAKSSGDPQHELRALRELWERRVDAVIRVSGCSDRAGLGSDLPGAPAIVTINDSRHEPGGCSVQVDNVAGGREATQHLLELGHRRIAYISGPDGASDSAKRQKGYEQALSAWGLTVNPDLIVAGSRWPQAAAESAIQLTAMHQAPTALFCYNDVTALGAISGIRAAGLRVPQDTSVVGFDDIGLAPFFDPPLTTIAQPVQALCETAVERVMGLIRGQATVDDAVLPGQLIIRESTAPHATIAW